MSTSIDQAFVKQFEREVHEAYQRQGSKLRGTVRVKNGVVGSSTVFQRVGTAAAQTKGRHAMVPVMTDGAQRHRGPARRLLRRRVDRPASTS